MELLWTKQIGTSDYDGGRSIAVDSYGDVYVTGSTYGTLPGQTNAGSEDIFLIKYPAIGGDALWTKQIGTSDNDFARSVAVDSSDNVIVTGATSGTLPGQTNAGSYDIFLIKYPSDGGDALWTKQIGTSESDIARGVAVDSHGDIYVTGYTYGTLPGQTSAGSNDIFLIKYPSDGGDALWTKQIGTSDYDEAYSIAVDSSDNVYVTGTTYCSFPGQSTAGSNDIFLIKYPSDGGVALWTKQIGTSEYDIARGVAVDSSDNVYVTGTTIGILSGQTSAGSNDIFLIKYPANGDEAIWTKQFGTSDYDEVYSIAVDSHGDVYVTGSTSGTLPGQRNAGSSDIFLIKYPASGGDPLWSTQIGTSDDDTAYGVAVDLYDHVYVTGSTSGTFSGQTTAGSNDIFLMKFYTTVYTPPIMSGITTDTFRTNDYPITPNNYEQGKFVMVLGTFDAVAGDILQLEIYYNAYSYDQTIAATNNDTTPSKLTVMLEVYDGSANRNIGGYCIQHGNFLSQYKISAIQETPLQYGIHMYFELYSFPYVHATTTGKWTPSNYVSHIEILAGTDSDPDMFYWGPTSVPGAALYPFCPIPIHYKLTRGMIETPNGFNVSSSRRYKTNITDFPDHYNLDMVMKMKSIVYQKKDEPGNTTIYPGLIAEDLHDLSGNLFVSYNYQHTPESIDYARLNVLLIAAIQQLNEKVNELAAKIERVKTRM